LMINNDIQFAVVREDPLLPLKAIRQRCQSRSRLLLIASGGCTALTIGCALPDSSMILIDKNPAQLQLVQRKLTCLQGESPLEFKSKFNIGYENPSGLNESGNFESLFRGFRKFIHDLVAPYEELKYFFESSGLRKQFAAKIFSNKYWPVAFEMFFSDSLLNAIFGPDATQHAEKGSYPEYFRACLERGLSRDDVSINYFLHHIFLGHYLDNAASLPPYLNSTPRKLDMSLHLGSIEDMRESIHEFDFIDLSNIFDWMCAPDVKRIAGILSGNMKRHAVLMFRQLNNHSRIQEYFSSISFDEDFGEKLLSQDRSLFYCKINIGIKDE